MSVNKLIQNTGPMEGFSSFLYTLLLSLCVETLVFMSSVVCMIKPQLLRPRLMLITRGLFIFYYWCPFIVPHLR